MVLWTAGSSPASHEARKLNLPFDTNKKGATLTDRNLQVLKQPRVFALGDVAGSEIPDLAPTAQVSGLHHRSKIVVELLHIRSLLTQTNVEYVRVSLGVHLSMCLNLVRPGFHGGIRYIGLVH